MFRLAQARAAYKDGISLVKNVRIDPAKFTEQYTATLALLPNDS